MIIALTVGADDVRKTNIDGLPPMKPKELNLVIEYTKDFSVARSAERAGYSYGVALELLKREDLLQAIDVILSKRLEASDIDAEWVLLELADNHRLARQTGELGISTRVLAEINKHKLVDGVSSAKHDVNMITDEDMIDRIRRGRNRQSAESDDEVSFI